MTLRILTSILFLSLLFTKASLAQMQDTIFFMNGKVLPCQIIDDTQIDVEYKYQKRKKTKFKSSHKSEIFALVNKGEKRILYAVNAVVGDDLSEKEVEVFLAGQRDARENFGTAPVFISGVAFSMLVAIVGKSGFISIAIPTIVYPILQMVPIIKIKEKFISDSKYKYNDIYADGFERVARGKKILAAIKSSVLGTVLGVIFYQLVLNE